MKIMNVLWNAETPMTSKDIMAHLTDQDWKYTTVVTMLGNLADRDLVNSIKIKRKKAHLYSPLVTRDAYNRQAMKKLLEDTGSARSLLCALYDRADISDDQYERLLKIIEE